VITGLDHMAMAVRDLASASRDYQAMFGRAPSWTGQVDGADHVWFQFPHMALDLVSPVGPGDQGAAVQAHLDASGEGLMAMGFRVDDLDGAGQLMARRGLETVAPLIACPDRPALALDPSQTGGIAIRLVAGDAPPLSGPLVAGESAISDLDHVVITTPNPDRALAIYGARLGLDLRLDRSQPAWGARQIFFRCGGLVVEIVTRLEGEAAPGPDALSGLAWQARVADPVQARLAGLGLNVSEVRNGRKPGTRIFTLRAGVVSAPTVVLQQNADPTGAA